MFYWVEGGASFANEGFELWTTNEGDIKALFGQLVGVRQ